jgi:hypothetical protein
VSSCEQNELGDNVDGYEYTKGYEVEEITDIHYSKKWKRVVI